MPRNTSASPSAVLLTGTVGVGKTTTAWAVADLLREAGVPHAVIDLDALAAAWPSPEDDPFHLRLTLTNLRDVARNHVAAGAVRLLLAGVLEDPADRPAYEEAVGVPLTVCRLRLELPVVAARLRRRHADDAHALDWHLRRSGELDGVLDAGPVEDVAVTVDPGATPREVAAEVLRVVAQEDTGA